MPKPKKPKIGRPNLGLSEATVIFRAPAELRDQVTQDAKRQGISVTEWWRQAAREKLKG